MLGAEVGSSPVKHRGKPHRRPSLLRGTWPPENPRSESGATVGGGDVAKMSGGAVVRGASDGIAAKTESDFLQPI